MSALTRTAIKQSFLKMLNDRPLQQVTIKAIVEDCGINRNTFYYYFEDVPSLLNEIVMENADRLIAEHAHVGSLEECLSAATQFVKENRKVVMNIYRSASRDLFERYLIKVCHDVVAAYINTVLGELNISREDQDILIRFYQCELTGQVLLWLESDMKYDIQTQFARLCELLRGVTEEMIRRCERGSK